MKHLTSEQISKLAAGSFAELAEEERHSRECLACAAELSRLRDVLSLFRSSVRGWTEKQSDLEFPAVIPALQRSVPIHRQSMTWVLVGAGLALAIAVPVYRESRDRQLRIQAEEDVQLTENVNKHLSRSVPVAMNNLMMLMNDGTSASGPVSTESKDATSRPRKTGKNGGVQ